MDKSTLLSSDPPHPGYGTGKIDWKLATDLPAQPFRTSLRSWIRMPWWKIETFHKIPRSGRGAEESNLSIAERLVKDGDFVDPELLSSLVDNDEPSVSGRKMAP